MSERQQLEAMLTRAGMVFEVQSLAALWAGRPPEKIPKDAFPKGAEVIVKIKSRSREWPQAGYGGFFTDWYFDASGALVGVGIWE